MRSASIRRTAVKLSNFPIKLRHHFGFTVFSVAFPDLLTWFEVLGYTVLLEPDIILGRHKGERSNYTEVVLVDRLSQALRQINPTIPSDIIYSVICQVTSIEAPDVLGNNRRFHQLLTEGVEVEYLLNDKIVRDKVWLIDPSNLAKNDWLVIHPFTVVEGSYAHCPDVVVFINGLPLAVIVNINPGKEKKPLKIAKERLETYRQQIPKLFNYNTLLVICAGNYARVGTLTCESREFFPWHTIDGEDFPQSGASELEVLAQGIFDKRRFLDLVKHFIVFEETEDRINKKLIRRPFCTLKTRLKMSLK
ncbi:type I restriction endonuclease [Aetokthonos hydrillicola Thurmond2011]|jgi:type I site-specific restriction-modification system R (restriction) subunit|uniref:type I site-specific deoxyribonuclease n=1 Tax=Aetokthonos hydrillicola Thurmond2011 TaxID=2712845 RepID=A0AAP5MBM9_9CYAN|nr:type I restriction endonuclease [Aetokthonos hydrillicola]MBO3462327.1 type I restriction endonuclease subunit R [Aetokthonos hydrillicola CCALA 1050]MBW4588818.1 hypothetical protein [Aetokthonos hydrillicola CCALA 1050]MDR9897318.1 type I restriction endonuclease [Aetokthonos hydrillicola Thurmond2011]